jgi:hypothetical protein
VLPPSEQGALLLCLRRATLLAHGHPTGPTGLSGATGQVSLLGEAYNQHSSASLLIELSVDDEAHCLFSCAHPTLDEARDTLLEAIVPPFASSSLLSTYADFWALAATGRVPLPVPVKYVAVCVRVCLVLSPPPVAPMRWLLQMSSLLLMLI